MKKLGLLLFPLLAITLILGGNAFATAVVAGDPSDYFVTYYSNANTTGAPDATLRLINDGDQATENNGEGQENGNLWAAIYVFDNSQEFQACCSCIVTPDGLLSESVNKQLTSNELTGYAEKTVGVIKVVSSENSDPTDLSPVPGLRGTMTHIQVIPPVIEGTKKTQVLANAFAVTETPLSDSNLSLTEETVLESLCSFAITLGSGHGVCSCTQEDFDW
jgi:hypothetical protein